MSAYVTAECRVQDVDCLVAALRELFGDCVEQHSEAVEIVGWRSAVRLAHVVVRKANAGGLADVGFLRRPDGTFEAVVDDYDSGSRHGPWSGILDRRFGCRGGLVKEVVARAAVVAAERAAQRRGMQTRRRVEGRRITLEVTR